MFMEQFVGGEERWGKKVLNGERLRDEMMRKRKVMNSLGQRIPERTYYPNLRVTWRPDDDEEWDTAPEDVLPQLFAHI